MSLYVEAEKLAQRKRKFSFEQLNEKRGRNGLPPYRVEEMLTVLSLLQKKHTIKISYQRVGDHIVTYYQIVKEE